MRLTLHRPDVGVDDDGQWWQRDPDDLRSWLRIEKPSWAEKREASEPHPMTDPYKRQPMEIRMMTVRRTLTRVVPDFEAEVLARQGWEIVTDSDNIDGYDEGLPE